MPVARAIQEDIYDEFMERASTRRRDQAGRSADAATMIGAQASSEQQEKILSYFDIGRKEGAEVLIGGSAADLAASFKRVFHQPDGSQRP